MHACVHACVHACFRVCVCVVYVCACVCVSVCARACDLIIFISLYGILMLNEEEMSEITRNFMASCPC